MKLFLYKTQFQFQFFICILNTESRNALTNDIPRLLTTHFFFVQININTRSIETQFVIPVMIKNKITKSEKHLQSTIIHVLSFQNNMTVQPYHDKKYALACSFNAICI